MHVKIYINENKEELPQDFEVCCRQLIVVFSYTHCPAECAGDALWSIVCILGIGQDINSFH